MALNQNLTIEQGKTYSQVVRWESLPIIYKAITAISKTAPVRITAVGHGVPPGWRCAVVSAKGMTQINALNSPPRDNDYHQATVVDADNVEFNDVNSSEFSTYTSGGYLQFNTPVDLTGYTARMTIKNKIGGTLLMSLTSVDGRIVIDPVNRKITLNISATDTEAITWARGVYDLELVSATGVVTALMAGSITVSKEVTTP